MACSGSKNLLLELQARLAYEISLHRTSTTICLTHNQQQPVLHNHYAALLFSGTAKQLLHKCHWNKSSCNYTALWSTFSWPKKFYHLLTDTVLNKQDVLGLKSPFSTLNCSSFEASTQHKVPNRCFWAIVFWINKNSHSITYKDERQIDGISDTWKFLESTELIQYSEL